MYNPKTSTRHPALKLATIGLCSIFGLMPFTFHAGAQTSPPQPQAVGTAASSVPNPPPVAAPQTPTGTESNLYNWDNTQGISWNTAIKSEQQVIAEFQAKVKQSILNACTYPPLRPKQPDKIAELAIQIDSNGIIGNIDVNNSSGHKQFDAALMLAAKKISEPLLPPNGRAITLLVVFKNSELGQVVPTKDLAKDQAADQPSVTPPLTPPLMQTAPANK